MAKTNELLLPSGAVEEFLGVRPPVSSPILPNTQVNLRKLNVTDPVSPAFGEWVDRHAVLKWLRAWNEKAGGDRTISRMIRQYREVLEI